MKNCQGCKELTINFIRNPLTPLKYNVYENIMEIRAFALLEQMLHFPSCFQKYPKIDFFFQCGLNIEKLCHDLKIANGVKS